MSGDNNTLNPSTSQPDSSSQTPNHEIGTGPEDRSALLDRARVFLTTPQIRDQDVVPKRNFLVEKGLNESEINSLVQELPPQPPVLPPRTYPQPPPSNLPNLLLGLVRFFSWATGGSAVLLLIYWRFLLPRLKRTADARRSLQLHHAALLERLNSSLSALKATQAETFAVLPRPAAHPEDAKYRNVHTFEDLRLKGDEPLQVPPYTLLRCALEDLTSQGKKVDTEELFAVLESRYAWLKTNDGLQFQKSLWETLNSNSEFEEAEESARTIWTFKAPADSESSARNPPLLASATSLLAALPPPRPRTNPFQHTLQALTDFTGYITTQTYSLTTTSFRLPGLGLSPSLTPQEEEIRKEIRALKGLVLNRRSFVPTPPPRLSSQTPTTVSSGST